MALCLSKIPFDVFLSALARSGQKSSAILVVFPAASIAWHCRAFLSTASLVICRSSVVQGPIFLRCPDFRAFSSGISPLISLLSVPHYRRYVEPNGSFICLWKHLSFPRCNCSSVLSPTFMSMMQCYVINMEIKTLSPQATSTKFRCYTLKRYKIGFLHSRYII